MSDISTKSLSFYTLLNQGLLVAAFRRLKKYAEKKMLWEVNDKLKVLEQSYFYMIKYALSATPDPSRDKIRDDIVSQLTNIYEGMRRKVDATQSSNIYFSTLKSTSSTPLNELLNQYTSLSSHISSNAMMGQMTQSKDSIVLEGLARDIFNKVWTLYPINALDKDYLSDILTSDSVSVSLKTLIVSALSLGNMKYFDDTRLMLLADVYQRETDEKISLLALVGMLLSLVTNSDRQFSRDVKSRLAALRELSGWSPDLNMVTLEFVRTLDTRRINDSMNDYFKNTFSKVGDEVRKSIRDLSKIEDLAELEENPEWMEMLDKTGISDKMKELTELQEEGADVFLQPFRQLKNDPFFYEISNWFLPFEPSNSSVVKIDSDGLLSEMVAQTPFLCDNDKYSFILALGHIPEEQRKMMLSQLEAGNIGFAAEEASNLNLATDRRKRIINKCVQSLYRFFELFRRKDDFGNPFNGEINLANLPLLSDDFNDTEIISLIAEFYFKHKYYPQALAMLLRLELSGIVSAELFQKIGYCYQFQGEINKALTYYEQADLLNSQSTWTIRRIAQCYEILNIESKALQYYKSLNQLSPGKPKLLIAIARCLMEMAKYKEAIKYLYEADYIAHGNKEITSMIAKSLFASGEKDNAAPYFGDMEAAGNLSITDRILLGHFYLAEGDVTHAMELYCQDINVDDNYQIVVSAIASDSDILKRYGFDQSSIDLIIEAVTMNMPE